MKGAFILDNTNNTNNTTEQPSLEKPLTWKEKKKLKRKFRLKILGAVGIIIGFSAISGACGLIPIPFVGLVPFIASLYGMDVLLFLVFGRLKNYFETQELIAKSMKRNIFSRMALKFVKPYSSLLLAVNIPGNAIKAIPYFGTIVGIVVSIVCMTISTIIYGLMTLIPLVSIGYKELRRG